MTISTLVRTIVACLSVSSCFAAEPDRWKGLVLNESTPQQAIQVLGAPQKDATGEIEKLARNKMFNISSLYFLKTRKADVVRVLKYDDVENFKMVSLAYKDDKLVLIHLAPSKDNRI